MPNNIEKMIKLIENKIKEFQLEKSKITSYTKEISVVEKIHNDLSENVYLLSDDEFYSKIMSILNDLDDENKKAEIARRMINLSYYCKGIAILRAKGIENHNFSKLDLSQEEQETLDLLLDALKRVDEIYKERHTSQTLKINSIEEKEHKLLVLYNKMIKAFSLTEHFTEEEINLLLDISSNQELEFKIDILDFIYNVTNEIENNKINTLEENDDENTVELNEEIVKEQFEKYGFNYDKIPNEIKNRIRKTCDLTKLIEVLKCICETPELRFLRNEDNFKVKSKYYKKLYQILRHATKYTLEYIVNDSKKRGVEIKRILLIDGVYKPLRKAKTTNNVSVPSSNTSLNETGSFDYYIRTSKFLDDLSRNYQEKLDDPTIDFYKTTLLKCPSLFMTPTEYIVRNIVLAFKYKLQLIEKIKGTIQLQSPTLLVSRNFIELIDLALENPPLYEYVVTYPTILSRQLDFKKILQLNKTKDLEFNEQGKIISSNFNKTEKLIDQSSFENILSKVPERFKILEINDDIENPLDSITEIFNSTIDHRIEKGLVYIINGVYVSKYKFLRIWNNIKLELKNNPLTENDNCSLKDLIIYSLTYNSYYSESEIEKLTDFVNKMEIGGFKNGFSI